jgi:DNA-binding transcriptional LysR family regulator
MDRFEAITAFVAVADNKGFAPAARYLRLSPSVVTRLVAGLEERLGVLLFQRTTRVVSLTEAGTRFLERARRVLADLDEAERMAESERVAPAGLLVVTAPVMFGRLHVMPLINRYMDRYPDVRIELRLTDRIVNLVEEGIDVAVRIGALADSSDVARRVGTLRRVVVASPKYLRARGVPKTPKDIARHDAIIFGGLAPSASWHFKGSGVDVDVPVVPRLTVNDAAAAADAAIDGKGLVMMLSYQVAPEVRAGRLRVVLADFERARLPIQVVFPSSRLLSMKVRAFIELTAETCDWSFEKL